MVSKENAHASKMIRWIRKNFIMWDLICGDGLYDYTVKDCIEILEALVTDESYELAFVLLSKVKNCRYVDEAITNVIVNRINKPKLDMGIITECIEEIRDIAIKKDVMEQTITV